MLSSYHQQRLWFVDHFEKNDLYVGGPIYHNVPLFLRIGGVVYLDDLNSAFLKLMEIHSVLRTKLTRVEGEIFQEISPLDELNIKKMFLVADQLMERQEELRQVPFDFEAGKLLKAYYEIHEDYTDVFFVIHHAIIDGYSLNILKEQFLALVNKEESGIEEGAQFQSFSNWQNALNEEDLEPLMFHWKSKLKDLQVLYFATDREREQVHIYKADSISINLDNKAILSFCKQENLSARSLILAAYKMAFARLTGLSDIVIGTFMDLRNQLIENVVGPVENLVVLRSMLDKEKTLFELCRMVDREWKEAEDFKIMPFDKLVTILNPKKDMSRTALFDVLFVYRKANKINRALDENAINQGWGKYDFNLLVTENRNNFDLTLTFNALYFNNQTAKSLLNLVESILNQIVKDDKMLLKQVPLLSLKEQKKIIKKNNTSTNENRDTLISRFSEQVSNQNTRNALCSSVGEMSYLTLDAEANQMANFLISHYQLKAEDKVAIILPKSEQLIVTILAVLKSGAAYVPVDPSYPEERKAFMISDASCKLVIDSQFLNDKKEDILKNRVTPPDVEIKADHLAYIIYTSGTTGKPKGVMIEHGNVISLLDSCSSLFIFSENDTWTFFHSYCFDFSIWEIFGCLLSGGKLLIINNEEARNQELTAQLMNTHQVTVFSQTPSAFYNFIEMDYHIPSLRDVVFGGEALHPLKLKKWHESNPGVSLINMYGITETTVHVTFKSLTNTDLDSSLSNIGKPLSFANVYILDAEQNLLPHGRPGEMYVSGQGVARGYLNRPEVNAERFIDCPFDSEIGTLYRTGDIVRFLESGELEYLGRVDDQVKIRGYRIELDEIRKQLNSYPGVKQSAVNLLEMPDGDKNIAAYVAIEDNITISDIKEHISGKIPEYMVPSFIIKMDHIPINSNGKVDKSGLPSPLDGFNESQGEIIPPSNDIETRLFNIWSELLNTSNFGIKHSFFDLGGHSLKATRLVSAIHKTFKVKLELKQLFSNPTLEQQGKLIKTASKVDYAEIPKVADADSYPVSDGQKRLWILNKLAGAAIAYHMPFHVDLNGDYSIILFKKALNAVIERHEMLRTVFKEDENGELRQWILSIEDLNFQIDHVDFTTGNNSEQLVRDYIKKDIKKPFDLSAGPLIRAGLLHVSENSYVFYYNLHHIIGDGWSMEVLTKEVLAYYQAYKENETPAVAPLKIQYKDFVNWQQGQNIEAQKAYWNLFLSGELSVINLPDQKIRPKNKTYEGRHLSTWISAEDTRATRKFIEKKGGSLFMVLAAAWNVLMYRYTGQQDVILGTAVAGRPHDDLAGQIGFYVNTLALRNQVDPELDFDGFYEGVKQNTLAAFEHQMYPFDRLVDDLKLTRDSSRNAVFDIMLILQNAGERVTINIDETHHNQIIDEGKRTSKFDIDVFFQDMGDCLSFNLIYNTDIYESEMVNALMHHYKKLLKNLIGNAQKPLKEIDYITQEERNELLFTFNQTDTAFPSDKTLINLFEDQVEKNPNSVALVYEDKKLSYADLNKLSNQFANYLKEVYQLESEEVIGLKLERSELNVVAIMAILKTGSCCCPIDPATSAQRLKHITDNCKLVLDEEDLTIFLTEKDKYPGINLNKKTNAANLAYIVHTSGSSGIPKGCMLEHQGIVNHVFNKIGSLALDDKTILCHTSKFYFVGGIWQLWATLIVGGKLLISNNEELLNTSLLLDKVVENDVRILEVIPSQLNNVFSLGAASKLKGIEKLILTGEKLNSNYVNRFFDINPAVEIINTYGQSECSDVTTSYTILTQVVKDKILIGKPIQNIRMYVLDQHLQLCPKGVVGELYTSGIGVCRGYLKRAEQTADAFIENPFETGSILYKTGDLGKWNSDGNLEILGRIDEQIKIRGHRIDLGEIENALLTYPGVREASVIVLNEKSDDTSLAAYIGSDDYLDIAKVRAYLKKQIPEYMLPLFFVQLNMLPLTSNGKVDKRGLPFPTDRDIVREETSIAAKTDLEKKLVTTWKKLLNLDDLGITDDFFALGGHSLKATSLLNAYHKEFNILLKLEDIFIHTTIEAHALLIEAAVQHSYQAISQVTESEGYLLSAGQRRLWVLSQLEEGSVAYNMPFHLRLQGDYDIPNFTKAIDSTIARHEALRTVFKKNKEGELRQWIIAAEELDFHIDYQDFRNSENKQLAVESYILKDSSTSFDLENGPLLRAALLQTDEQNYVFYYNLHHIISDGWSMNVLMKDVLAYYSSFTEDIQFPKEALNIQYKDYAAWQTNKFGSIDYKKQEKYWLDKLSGNLPRLNLPANKLRPKLKTHNGEMLCTYISPEELLTLKTFIQEHGGSLFMGLLAVWKVLFYKYTDQKDILIGTPVAGRAQMELEEQIGFYVNTLVLRNQIDPKQKFVDFYNELKTSVISDFSHQDFPFDNLVESLQDVHELSRNFIFDVILVLQNTGERIQRIQISDNNRDDFTIVTDTVSKFDLEIIFKEVDNHLDFKISYNTDIYDRDMVEGLMLHFKRLLTVILIPTELTIAQTNYLSKQEKERLFYGLNNTKQDYPNEKTIVDIFEEQAVKTAGKVAVSYGDHDITYQELAVLSNQFAQYLLSNYELNAEDLIGIKLERSDWAIVTILAILKTGAAYVPIDPDYPVQRIEYITEDSNCKLTIDQKIITEFIKVQHEYSKVLPVRKITPQNLAYVMYTSGSTGKPKGVMIAHKSVVSLVKSSDYYKYSASDNLLATGALSFDATTFEFFGTLLNGGQLIICATDTLLNINSLSKLIVEKSVNVMWFTAGWLSQLVDQEISLFAPLKTILTGGDKLSSFHIGRLREVYPDLEIINGYGPTENTTFSLTYNIKTITSDIPIGYPLSNSTVYILDDHQNTVPFGVTGEIYVGGDGLARGYLNRPELTEEKFMWHPEIPGERLYRTGDLGKWSPGGYIEFAGRKDNQLKIRGHRIELGEIAFCLLQKESIKDVVIDILITQDQEKELVGYLVSESEENAAGLRSYLLQYLPEYMVPGKYVQLKEFPLDVNGKIDRKSLLNTADKILSYEHLYIAPRNKTEEKLVNTWQEILGLKKIGIKDNFFEIGGHSIKAIKVISQVNKEFNIEINIRNLFLNPTIEHLAAQINFMTKQKEIMLETQTLNEIAL